MWSCDIIRVDIDGRVQNRCHADWVVEMSGGMDSIKANIGPRRFGGRLGILVGRKKGTVAP